MVIFCLLFAVAFASVGLTVRVSAGSQNAKIVKSDVVQYKSIYLSCVHTYKSKNFRLGLTTLMCDKTKLPFSMQNTSGGEQKNTASLVICRTKADVSVSSRNLLRVESCTLTGDLLL